MGKFWLARAGFFCDPPPVEQRRWHQQGKLFAQGRKHHDVAQRQHRIGSGFTCRKRWAWLCSGHGPKSVLLSLSAVTRLCAATTECRWAAKGIWAAAAISALKEQV